MDHYNDILQLIQSAEAARAAAYTPYSHFSVGAALLCRRTDPAATSSGDSCTVAFSDDSRALKTDFSRTSARVNATCAIISGCNIENKAYGSSMCAERTAVFKAVSEGFSDFLAIAIVGGPEGCAPLDYCAPCGACRQVLSEFAPPDFKIILAKNGSDYKVYTLAELLPEAFSFARD